MILDLIALDNASKVWIYQSDKEFTYDELDEAREHIFHFLNEWTAHSAELDSYGNIFHKRFLAFFVDESKAQASGCSIDKSVKFVEALGAKFGKDMFDRMTYAYMDDDEEIKTVHHSQLSEQYKAGVVTEETFFFNNLVTNKGEFLERWVRPLGDSWHKRFV